MLQQDWNCCAVYTAVRVYKAQQFQSCCSDSTAHCHCHQGGGEAHEVWAHAHAHAHALARALARAQSHAHVHARVARLGGGRAQRSRV